MAVMMPAAVHACLIPQLHTHLILQLHVCLLLQLCTQLTLYDHIVHQNLHRWVIVLKVQDQVYLPQAPVLGQGVHQVPAAQAHWTQAPVMSLAQAPKQSLKHLQRVAALVARNALALHHLK